jgi:hypothetical protein
MRLELSGVFILCAVVIFVTGFLPVAREAVRDRIPPRSRRNRV